MFIFVQVQKICHDNTTYPAPSANVFAIGAMFFFVSDLIIIDVAGGLVAGVVFDLLQADPITVLISLFCDFVFSFFDFMTIK